jgi:hypothetical protein
MDTLILAEYRGKMPEIMRENELKCSVSGSFIKFKPEIDLIIDEFTDLKVTVLAPSKGWLYIPRRVFKAKDFGFRPLLKERGMSIRQVEDDFLESIRESDFLYVANFEGYVGNSVSFEIGFAIACGVPVFSREPIKINSGEEPWLSNVLKEVKVATPGQVKELLTKAGK